MSKNPSKAAKVSAETQAGAPGDMVRVVHTSGGQVGHMPRAAAERAVARGLVHIAVLVDPVIADAGGNTGGDA